VGSPGGRQLEALRGRGAPHSYSAAGRAAIRDPYQEQHDFQHDQEHDGELEQFAARDGRLLDRERWPAAMSSDDAPLNGRHSARETTP
jgi:hypothetical protein